MIKLFFLFIFDLFFGLFLWLVFDSLYQLFKLKKYKSCYVPLGSESFFYKVIFRLPGLIAQYFNDLRSDEFKEHGLYLFCGEQGSGKTMSMTYNINMLILNNPGVFVLTNYGLMCQDRALECSDDLLKYHRPYTGIIYGIDEIQATWNSRKWQNMSPEILATLCQNRKSYRVIYGTCQSVSQVDKAIRLQTRRYINCWCLFGILNICLWYKPHFDFEGNLEKSTLKKVQIFLQEDSLRYQYNTFDLIKSLR